MLIKKQTSYIFNFLFLSVIFFIVLFQFNPDYAYKVESLRIFSPTMMMLAITILLSVYVIANRNKIRRSNILLILIARFAYYLAQFLLVGGYTSSLSTFLNLLYPIVIFIYISQIKIDRKIIMYLSMFIISVIFSQIILSRLYIITQNLPVNMSKTMIQVPVGGSNYVASILLLLYAANIFNGNSRIVTILTYLSILLLKSKGGIITLIIMDVTKFLFQFLQKENKKKRVRFNLRGVLLPFLILVFVILGATSFINSFAGRLSLFNDVPYYLIEKPFLGYGFLINGKLPLVHNNILQILLYGGVFGLLIEIWLFFSVYMNNKRKIVSQLPLIMLLLILLVHGSMEPNYFTSTFDIFYWMIFSVFFSSDIPKEYFDILYMNKQKKKISIWIMIITLFFCVGLTKTSRPTIQKNTHQILWVDKFKERLDDEELTYLYQGSDEHTIVYLMEIYIRDFFDSKYFSTLEKNELISFDSHIHKMYFSTIIEQKGNNIEFSMIFNKEKIEESLVIDNILTEFSSYVDDSSHGLLQLGLENVSVELKEKINSKKIFIATYIFQMVISVYILRKRW